MLSKLFPLVALFIGITVNGAIYEYKDVELENLFLKYRSTYMYSKNGSPAKDESNPLSFIKFDLSFKLENPETDNLDDNFVQVTIFNADQLLQEPSLQESLKGSHNSPGKGVSSLSSLGYILNTESFCCSEDKVSEDSYCNQPNELFSPALNIPESKTFFFDFSIGEEDENGNIVIDGTGNFPIASNGLHVVMFSYCQKDHSFVKITGQCTWHNPFGYLPGELYGFLGFYLCITLSYLFAAVVWGYLCFRHWKDLLMLQNCITAVILLGMVEVTLRYFDFHTLNEHGLRNHGLMLFSLVFLAVKKSVSRMLVLVVSMGFGVVRPTLGEEKSKVMYLGVAFLTVSFLDSVFTNLSNAEEDSLFVRMILQVPLAIIDTYFCFWIFRSLSNTLISLEKRGQSVKYTLYIKFQRLVAFNVTIAAFWSILCVAVRIFGWMEISWEKLYILDCFWDVVYFVILLGIMYLWKPNAKNIQFAYSAINTTESGDDGDEFDDGLDDVIGDFKLGKGNKNILNPEDGSSPSKQSIQAKSN